MRHVQVIRLGQGRRHVLPTRLLHLCDATRHRLVIVTDPDDLHHAIEHILECRHDGRRKLDGPFFAIHVWGVTRSDAPIRVGVDPDIERVFRQDVDHRLHRLARDETFADDGEIGPHEEAAVERGDRVPQLEIVDQHLHAQWGTAARDREGDARLDDVSNGGTRLRRQDLVRRHERAVDICHDEAHLFVHVACG